MTDQPQQIGGGRRSIGDFSPKLAALTDDVLSPTSRSMRAGPKP
jgi:hypothetical protein